MDEQKIDNEKHGEVAPNRQATAIDNERPVVDLPDSKTKSGPFLLTSISFALTIIAAIICGPIMALVPLVGILFGPSGGYLIVYALYGIEFVKYAPFVILIALSAILMLIFSVVDMRRMHGLDDSVKNKIAKRSLVSAILLFAPAVTYPIAYIIRLYEIGPFGFSHCYLGCGLLAILAIDIVSLAKTLRARKEKGQVIKIRAKFYILTAIILFVVELILCGVWCYSIARYRAEADRAVKVENNEREQALKALRNPLIDDGLSDVAATKCAIGKEYRQYEIIYSDSRTEGIFKCDIADSASMVFYAAYYGENENGKIDMSLIELGRIYGESNRAETSIIGETGWSYEIIFVNAEDDESALEQAKAHAADASLSPYSSNRSRTYIFYTNRSDIPTTKDYLNAILSSNIYLSNGSLTTCSQDINWGINEKKYKCIKAKGDLFQKYINDKDNYSAYSIDALYKNRHLYLAPLKLTSDEDRTGLETKGRFVIFWREPFTQGKLTFNYLPQEVFDKHDGDLDWEDEDSSS